MKENAVKKLLSEKKVTELPFAVLCQLISAVCGFLMSRVMFFGGYAPLGIAATAGMSPDLSIAAAIGAAAGYLFPVTENGAIRYIGAVITVTMLKWILPEKVKFARTGGFCALLALLGSLSGIVFVKSFDDFIMCVAEGLVCASTAYFVSKVSAIKNVIRSPHGLGQPELVSVAVLAGALLMSLAEFDVVGITPSRIIAVYLIITAARFGREAAGAIVGAAFGFAMSLASNDMLFIAGAYSLGGMAAGLFAHFGVIGCGVAFLVSSSVIFIQSGQGTDGLICLLEIAAALLFAIFTPKNVQIFFSALFAPSPEMPRLDGLRKTVSMRLKGASDALSNVDKTLKKVSYRLAKINTPEYDQIFRITENDVCGKCGLRIHCWEKERSQTMSSMALIMKEITTGEEQTIPLKDCCSKTVEIKEKLEKEYGDYLSKQAARRRIDEVRSVVCDQFEGMAAMLNEMAIDFAKSRRYDTQTARLIGTRLKELGIIATDISCSIDKHSRMTVEIRTGVMKQIINRTELLKSVSSICGRDFDPPTVITNERGNLISFSEKAVYSIDYGIAQHSCRGAKICGDSGDIFTDGRGSAIMILSDGMGTGGRAAVDSAMASGLMAQLLKAGFGYDCSLKMVNSAMLFKSVDESLATLDAANIDLFTGRIDMYKAGAAPTVIRQHGYTGKAECSSIPVGILREVKFDCAGVNLAKGDIVVMMSDGVATDGTGWISRELADWDGDSAQQLAEKLADMALRRLEKGHEDDITVMVAILENAA